LNVKTCHTWEGNVTTRRDISIKHVLSLGCGDIREGVTLQRLSAIKKINQKIVDRKKRRV
jgi:hypothetical protein